MIKEKSPRARSRQIKAHLIGASKKLAGRPGSEAPGQLIGANRDLNPRDRH